MGVLYAAEKYIVTRLVKKCTEFLEENLSAETAIELLEQSIIFDKKDLKEKVLATIKEEACVVLSSEEFDKLSKEALHEILQLDLWITSELEVFEATMNWAQAKCKELKKSVGGVNLRGVLTESFFLIRFPTMSLDDFNDVVVPYDILNS